MQHRFTPSPPPLREIEAFGTEEMWHHKNDALI